MKNIFDPKWIASSFSLSTLLLIPVCVAVNIVGSQLNRMLGLPLFFDAIGTMFVAMISGPWIGGITGLLTNIIGSIVLGDPNMIAFSTVSVAIGISAGILSYKKMFLTPIKAVIGAIVVTFFTLATSVPTALFVFGGATGGNSDFITSLLIASGVKLVESVLSTQAITNGLDKFISIGIAYVLIKSVPKRFLSKQPLGFVYLDTISHDEDKWND